MTGQASQGVTGRRVAWASAAAIALGIAAVATGLGPDARSRTVGELIASWLFFAGIAVGAPAFRAFFRIVDAGWARPLAPLGGAQAEFLPVAALVLAAILAWAGVSPWVAHPSGWLGSGPLVLRQAVLNAVLFGLAWLGLRARAARPEGPSRALAIAYAGAYAIVLSFWGFDFVLGPDPVWGSTLVGPFLFMSAFAAGTGVVILRGLARGALGERERRDAGALVFALAVFWAYLFWSQFLTMWYANLPEEIGFGLRRAVDGWDAVVVAVIGLVFVVPLFALVPRAGRGSPRFFGAVLVAQLAGFWLGCHLLVVPSLSPRGTPPLTLRDVLIAAGMLGAFVLTTSREVPAAPGARGQPEGGAEARQAA